MPIPSPWPYVFSSQVSRDSTAMSITVRFRLVLLVIGVKESAVLNAVFTTVNITVIVIVVIAGLTKIDPHNWNIKPDEVTLIDELRETIFDCSRCITSRM
jgi:amino acid transporter